MNIQQWVSITSENVILNGEPLVTESTGAELLKELYRKRINDYPKFFKMDELSRLGFVASELLLQCESPRVQDIESRAVILFNRSGSMCNDRKYQKTIDNMNDYFPSPLIFVYTLSNIVTGEIAIRNKYYGETSFYVLRDFSTQTIVDIVETAFLDDMTESVICGWMDCDDRDNYCACLFLVGNGGESFNIEEINKKYIL